MPRGAHPSAPSWRTRGAIGVSLLAGAAAVAAAAYAPGLVANLSTPAPSPGFSAAALGNDELESARAQVALVDAEDARLLAQIRGIPWGAAPYVDQAHGTPTQILTRTRERYDLESLIALGAARRLDERTVELTRSVLLAPGTALVVDAPGTTLRLASGPDGFTSIVGWHADVELRGGADDPLYVESHRPDGAGPDLEPVDGRAYVRVVGARLETAHAELADLGFWSGRTGGLAVTGSDDGAPAAASVSGTTVRGGYFGFFAAHATDVLVADSVFEGNATDGVLLHRGVADALITTTTTRDNGRDGLAAGRGSERVTFRDVVAEHNAGDGVAIDGRPMARQPGPAGMSLDGHGGFRVEGATARANAGTGILVRDADDTVVTGASAVDNREGIVVRGPADDVTVAGNTVTGSERMAIAVRAGTGGSPRGVLVERNTVDGGETGIQVRDAVAAVLGNTVTGARAHGISVQGGSGGSAVRDNVLAGQGPSGLDLFRLAPGAVVDAAANDEERWDVVLGAEQRFQSLVSDSPMLALWVLVLLAPIAATGLSRRRHRGAALYGGAVVSAAGAAAQAGAAEQATTVLPAVGAVRGTRVTVLDRR